MPNEILGGQHGILYFVQFRMRLKILVQSLDQGMERRRQVGKVGVLIEGVGLRDALTYQRCEENRLT